MSQTTEELLNEREKTHGSFVDHARITQVLKEIISIECRRRDERDQAPLSSMQLESLDMIMHKVGRIIAGNPNEPDHWDDIAGYAKLINKHKPLPERFEKQSASEQFAMPQSLTEEEMNYFTSDAFAIDPQFFDEGIETITKEMVQEALAAVDLNPNGVINAPDIHDKTDEYDNRPRLEGNLVHVETVTGRWTFCPTVGTNENAPEDGAKFSIYVLFRKPMESVDFNAAPQWFASITDARYSKDCGAFGFYYKPAGEVDAENSSAG